MGGGGIMIWAGIGYYGRYKVYLSLFCKMNAKNYLELISKQIERYAIRIFGFIFQQDNAAVHTAKIVKSYFEANNILLLE